MHEKRGQALSINTIILLILGIIVLVFLILGFTLGWNKISPFIKPSNNVKEIQQSCGVACSTNADYDYCYVKRELKTDEETLKDVTCNYLVQKQTKYGIDLCPSIQCENTILVELLSGETLEDFCEGNEGKTVQALLGNTLQSKSCPATA